MVKRKGERGRKREIDRYIEGGKKPKEPAGSLLKTNLMKNDKGRSRDTKEHRYSTFERIFPLLSSFLFSFFLLEKQLVTPEDHWKLIGLYRVTAQKGGDPACNGLKRCLGDVDSLSTDSGECACPSRKKKKTARRILRYSWKQDPCTLSCLELFYLYISFLSRARCFRTFEDRKKRFFDFIVTLSDILGFNISQFSFNGKRFSILFRKWEDNIQSNRRVS